MKNSMKKSGSMSQTCSRLVLLSALLLHDLYCDSLYLTLFFDLVLLHAICACFYSMIAEIVLRFRRKRENMKLKQKMKEDPLYMPGGWYRDVMPFPVKSDTDRILQRANTLIYDEKQGENPDEL